MKIKTCSFKDQDTLVQTEHKERPPDQALREMVRILAEHKAASLSGDTCVAMCKCSCHLLTPWSMKDEGHYVYVKQTITVKFVRKVEKPPSTKRAKNNLGKTLRKNNTDAANRCYCNTYCLLQGTEYCFLEYQDTKYQQEEFVYLISFHGATMHLVVWTKPYPVESL